MFEEQYEAAVKLVSFRQERLKHCSGNYIVTTLFSLFCKDWPVGLTQMGMKHLMQPFRVDILMLLYF